VADFVTFEEAKKRLGKTDQELQAMMDKGELRGFRDAGTWKFRKEDIDAKAGAEGGEKKDSGDTLMSIDADILFAEEEEVPADSAAETWIAADTEGVFPAQAAADEQARGVEEAMAAPETEPAPLALSPETDESSLGAVLSDEELGAAPGGGEEPVIAVDAESGVASVSGGASGASAASRTRVVTLVEPPAHHAQFTFMLALAAIALGLGAYVIMGVLSHAQPSLVEKLAGESVGLMVFVGVAVVVVIAALVGFVLDKNRAAREAAGSL
jgi:hypothetical protein